METPIKYLLDTNTISDHLRDRKGPVGIWMDAHIEVSGISVITVAELRGGIESTNGKMRTRLEALFRYTLEDYRHGIFDFDQNCAMEWGRMIVEKPGRPIPLDDSYIAAIARQNDLIVVTRNTKHFPSVRTLNPWTGESFAAWAIN